MLAVAVTAWTTALVIGAASFLGENILGGDAGRFWARVFAAALGLTGLFMTLLALGLMGENIRDRTHYVVPVIVGLWAGAFEGMLLLNGTIDLTILLPLLLLILALRPARRGISRLVRRQPAGSPPARGSRAMRMTPEAATSRPAVEAIRARGEPR